MTIKTKKEAETPKPFDITKKRPKVLLLGNGIARAFGGQNSWDELLEEISDEIIPVQATNEMPMPLKATLLSKNKLQSKLDNFIISRPGWGFSVDKPQKEFLQKLLKLKFDYILTTNYTYEIECALIDNDKMIKEVIKEKRGYNSDAMQRKFFINTYNYFKEKDISVWHIHGEVGWPDSIALSNEDYGKLTGRYYEWINKNCFDKNKTKEIKSWIDAFLYGDLYIMGFGMDFSETDLWWLLQYKAKEQEDFGNTVFFDKDLKNKAKTDLKTWGKYKLFKVLNMKVEDCGGKTKDYKDFYEEVCNYLKTKEKIGTR